MPAERFTKRADTPTLRAMWQHIYDGEIARGLSRKEAIIRASGRVKMEQLKRRGQKGRGRD